MRTSIKAKVLALVLIAVCFVTCGIISLNTQTTVKAYDESASASLGAGNSNVYDGWDLSSIDQSKLKSSNPTGNYFYTNHTAGTFWAISAPITERKDIVVELDWETNGDGNHFIQFGPWSNPNAHEFNPVAFNYNWGQLILNQDPNYTLTIQDLTNPESQPQVVGQYAYGFIQGYRYRFTFEVTGDMYIAKRPIGSTEEFVDELKVVNFQVAPEEISEASPRIFRFHMFQYVVLGDLLLRYKDGTVIQQCTFDRDHVFAYANRHPNPGYFTSDHTNGMIYENKPYLKNLTTSEKIISDIIIDDNANIDEGTRIMTLNGIYDKYDFEAGKVLNFLFGLPEDLEEAKLADHTTPGVSCISLSFDGANYWAYMYYGGQTFGPGGGIALNNEFSFRADKNADGTTQLSLYSNSDGGGRIGTAVASIKGRVAIQVGGASANESSGIRFSKLDLSTYKFFEGEDVGVNFNSYDDTAINANINSEDWFINATGASQFADPSLAKGLNVTQNGELFFEGTSDGTIIAPYGKYGNFVLEFDYYDFANKPAQVESWQYGYSPLGVGVGRDIESQGWAGVNKLITFADNVAIQCYDEGAYSAANSSAINFKDVWTRIKIEVINDKVSVYTASLASKNYTELTAEDYTLVAEAQYNSVTGYVAICGTESAYFKLDNIKITNIDAKEYVYGQAIADTYKDVTVTATSNNEANGTVSGTTTVVAGTSVTLTATTAENCTFEGWYVGETKVSDATEYTFTATADVTVTAQFAREKRTVTVTAENGTVTGAGEYEIGSTATLTVTANDTYKFVKWTVNGEDAGTDTTITITVTENVTYVAIFEKIVYAITTTAENGTVTGAGEYEAGSTATLTATANEGYYFVKWTVNGEDAGTDTTITVTVNGNDSYVAVFAKIQYTVTVNAENGEVTGAGEYEVGATATLTATANEGYQFDGWYVGEEKVSSETTYAVTVDSNITITAKFTEIPVESTPEESIPEESTEPDSEESVESQPSNSEDITESTDSTESTESEITSTESKEESSKGNGGCMSGLGVGSIFALALIAGTIRVIRKKED